MDIYFAGMERLTKEFLDLDINVLMSYWYCKKKFEKFTDLLKEHPNTKVFIDSGAFTAWTKGVQLDVDEYIDWLNKYDEYLTLFGQVDVIPNVGASKEEVDDAASRTWENYLYMRTKLKSPDKVLYTYHIGEDPKFLQAALDWKDENGEPIKYMAFGGMVGKHANSRDKFLNTCFNIIKKSNNPHIQTHGFGMTDLRVCEKFPLTSVDSTDWTSGSRFGQLLSDYGRIFISEEGKNNGRSIFNLPEEALKNVSKMVHEFGFTIDELKDSSEKRDMYNLLYKKLKFKEMEPPVHKVKARLF